VPGSATPPAAGVAPACEQEWLQLAVRGGSRWSNANETAEEAYGVDRNRATG